jgi:hypothetical protein
LEKPKSRKKTRRKTKKLDTIKNLNK